jgi:Spy/CpxP family protein refolding chaperone
MQPPKMDIEKEIANMTKRYGLTDAQKEEIRPILVAQQYKLEQVFQDVSLAPEERLPKLRAIHDEQVAKVSEILTDGQRTKYQKDQKRMGHGSGPDGPPPPLDGIGGPPGL